MRGGPHHDLAGSGELLEALGGVDDVAHDGGEAPGPHRADEHLARVHPDPHLHPDAEIGGERGERGVHAQGRPHRPLGVVLVRDRGTEQRDDLVADDLVEVAAEVDDVDDEGVEAGVDESLHVLRVAGRREGGETDEIGHQHRDEATLVGGGDQALPAFGTEAGTLGYGRAARRAGHPLTIPVGPE